MAHHGKIIDGFRMDVDIPNDKSPVSSPLSIGPLVQLDQPACSILVKVPCSGAEERSLGQGSDLREILR